MSAPRKIWAYDDGLNSPDSRTWSATVPVGPAYHHDDLVRELVEALEEIAGSADDGDGWTSDGHERCTETARAALAKIAQDA